MKLDITNRNEGRPANMRLASCGVTWLHSSSVFQLGFCSRLTGLCFESPNDTIHVTVGQHAENPPHDQAHLVLQTQKPKLKNKRAKFS